MAYRGGVVIGPALVSRAAPVLQSSQDHSSRTLNEKKKKKKRDSKWINIDVPSLSPSLLPPFLTTPAAYGTVEFDFAVGCPDDNAGSIACACVRIDE